MLLENAGGRPAALLRRLPVATLAARRKWLRVQPEAVERSSDSRRDPCLMVFAQTKRGDEEENYLDFLNKTCHIFPLWFLTASFAFSSSSSRMADEEEVVVEVQ